MPNYFDYRSVAQRYARYRPYFHPLVIGKVKAFLQIRGPELDVLDLACGTGQSTIALEPVARRVIGAEITWDMLQECPAASFISYTQTAAEALPLAGSTFDLITVALAFHWFDRPRFFPEAARVLKSGGWLVLYTNGFTGAMRENDEFEAWVHSAYPMRYPPPPRNSTPLTADEAKGFGFEVVQQERFTNEVTFTPQTLANYLTTQSNVVAAVEQGKERLEDAYEWLVSSTGPHFKAPTGTFIFAGSIEYLQRVT